MLFFEKNKKQILDQPHITQLFLWSIGCAGSLLEPTTLRSFSFPKLVSAQFPSLTCSEHAMTCRIGGTTAMEDRSWVHATFSFAEGTAFFFKNAEAGKHVLPGICHKMCGGWNRMFGLS